MKTFKFILYLFVILPLASVQAVTRYSPYFQDRDVQRFKETGTIQDFAAIEDKYKLFAVSDLLSSPDGDPKDRDAFIIRDRADVYKKYLDSANSDQQIRVYSDAFELAVQSSAAPQAQDIFNRLMARKPSVANAVICNSLIQTQRPDEIDEDEQISITFDESLLPGSEKTVGQLLQFIAQSGSANTYCNLGTTENPRLMTISEIVSRTSHELYSKLYSLSREVQDSNLRVQNEYLNCSTAQVKNAFFQGLTILKDQKAKVSEYLIINDKSCVIDGLLKKVKAGYEFYPSNRIAGYQKKSLNFTTLEQIVQVMKSVPSVQNLSPTPTLKSAIAPAAGADKTATQPSSAVEKIKLGQFGEFIKYFSK